MAVKQSIARVLRSTGLIFFADKLRYWLASSRMHRKNSAYLQANPALKLPPPYFIYETFRLDYERYIETGIADAEWIRDTILPFRTLKDAAILDWGCGPGRVVRHLPAVVANGCKCFGTDYNQQYIDWCTANIKEASFSVNGLFPPLSYPDNKFDLIYGISIFTHLSAEAHEDWMLELLRVLKPDGILMLTMHGDITRRNLTAVELKLYDAGSPVFRAQVKEGHRMYTAYQPPAFVHRLIAGKGSVLLHKPGIEQSWGLEQDIWLFQKKTEYNTSTAAV